jgi:hypothetical protein
VPPVQVPTLKLALGAAQGVVQSNGLTTVIEVLQAPLAAFTITLVPTGIPLIILPLIVALAGVTVTTAPHCLPTGSVLHNPRVGSYSLLVRLLLLLL